MKTLLIFALALVSLSEVTKAKSLSAENEVELREVLLNLRDVLQSQKRKADEEEAQGMEHMMEARGAWDDFKASVKKAGQKVKNAFGKKNEEEERQFGLSSFKSYGWDDFKESLKKASQKVKNAFGKKNEEEERQFGGPEPSLAEKKKMKKDITEWKAMVKAFGIQNDPEIQKMEAQLDLVWQMLDLDDV